MNLMVLVAIVAGGLAVVFLALRLSGAGDRRRIDSAGEALAILKDDYPKAGEGPVLVTADRSAAFILLPDGSTGIVRVMGRHLATRLVLPRDVRQIRLDEGGMLSLRFRELGWSAMTVRFDDEAGGSRLAAHMQPDTVRN